MDRLLLFLLASLLSASCFAQASDSLNTEEDLYNLGFEPVAKGIKNPISWGIRQDEGYRIKLDSTEKYKGKTSLLIEKIDLQNPSKFFMGWNIIPAKFIGKEIELKIYLKLFDVKGFANVAMRIDDDDNDVLQYSNLSLSKKEIKGSMDWKQYTLKLPLPSDARLIQIWPILSGTGKVWFDDIELLIDGKSIYQAEIKPNYNTNPPKSIYYGKNANAGAKVKVKDAELYYETYGSGEPLLLLHGNSQSIHAFKKQITTLAQNYKVIAVDTRGQGKSTDLSVEPLSYDVFAEDMKILLDSLHISKTNILGWSDGGNTGLIMAYKHPSYVNKLAVMGANMYPTNEAIPSSILNEVAKQIETLKKEDKSKKQVRLYEMLLNEPHITLIDLQAIKAPVLVMAGEKDMILEKHTKYIASNISNSKLHIFKGASHYAPVEISEEFNKEVLSFFETR